MPYSALQKNLHRPGLQRQPRRQHGFTLIEALVATFLFAIAVSAILGVYNSVLQLNGRTGAIRSASENARFLNEFLSKELRNGRLTTARSAQTAPGTLPLTNPSNRLAIINVDGDHECFFIGLPGGPSGATWTGLGSGTVGGILWVQKNASTARQVTPSAVKIQNLQFFVSPTNINPSTAHSSVQPSVTVTAQVLGSSTSVNSPSPGDLQTVPVVTTISLREYGNP